MPYCPKCGDEFQDWAEVCPDCGVALVDKPPPLPKSKGGGDLGWEGVLLLVGLLPLCYVVLGCVVSLLLHWGLPRILLFAVLAANIVPFFILRKSSKGSGLGMKELAKEYWPYTLPNIATGILIIYTIIGVILGNIDWVWPAAGIGP